MNGPRLTDLVRQIAAAGRFVAATDGELLGRFVAERDDAAFAELVRRHGGMVLGVCRRALGDGADAEDAFQAAFLVLARKTASVRKSDALSAWLYGVAFRVAARQRARAARRREVPLTELPGPDTADNISWRDGLRVLDDELNRLPDAYRAPLVLCYLEGRTQDEAARQLGWTLGTLRGRLERGRARLYARLTRRGVGLAALAAVLVSESSAGAVPLGLRWAISKAAAGEATGVAAALAAEVMGAMAVTKLQWAAGLLAACAALTVGGVAATGQAPGGGAPLKGPPPAAPAKPNGRNELIELAGQAVVKGDIDGAYPLLRAAEAGNPLLPPARLMLARLCLNAGGVVRQRGRAVLEQALAEHPDHPAMHLTNAALALGEGRVAEAILSAEKALQLADAPRWTVAQGKGFRQNAHEVLAGAFDSRNDWAAVRTHSDVLLELDGSGRNRARLAKALFFLDKPDEALAEFRRAAKDDAKQDSASVQMARLWAVKGDIPKAREWFDAAVKDGPNDLGVRIAYADWLLARNDIDAATKQLEAAEVFDKAAPGVVELKGRIERANQPRP